MKSGTLLRKGALAAAFLLVGASSSAYASGDVALARMSTAEAMRALAQVRSEALNELILSPSEQTVQEMVRRGIFNSKQAPYIQESVALLNVPDGAVAENITPAMRRQLLDTVAAKQRAAILDSSSMGEAVARGLDHKLSSYFNACKQVYTQGGQTAVASQAAFDCMGDSHARNAVRPYVFSIGATAAMTLAAGLLLRTSRRER